MLKLTLAAGLLTAAVLAAPAGAQTSMNCKPGMSGGINCRETAGAQAERLNREAMEAQRRRMDSLGTPSAPIPAGPSRLERSVAKAIQAGKCEEARSMALDGGSVGLAEQAMRVCRPADPPPAT